MLRNSMLILALGLGVAGGLFAGDQERVWKATIQGKPAEIRFTAGEFSVCWISEGENVSSCQYAGSLSGLEPTHVGFYVGDLDGAGETSIAFREARQKVWYHGSFTNGALVLRPYMEEAFHLGQGPTLYPMDELVPQQPNENRDANGLKGLRLNAAAQQQSQFPVMARRREKLGASRYMDTTVTLYGDGRLYAVTDTSNGVWLAGYHGQAEVVLLDENRRQIIDCQSPKFGVTGTAFGLPFRRDGWGCDVQGDALLHAREASIRQSWAPEFQTVLNDVARWWKIIMEIAQPLISATAPKK